MAARHAGIQGQDEYYNLAAMGGPREGPPVRFGEFTVPSAVAWVSKPIGRSPGVRAEFVMRAGRPACVSVEVVAAEAGRPITTADLESLPGLDRKGADAFKAFATRVFDDEDWRSGINSQRRGEIVNPDAKEVRAALKRSPNDELQAIAEVYRNNINDAPVEAVQAAFGLARRTADRRIRAARDGGFLPDTTQGKKRA